MYSIIESMINHSWTTGDSSQQYIFYTCCALIIIITVTLIDLVYRIFRGFWGR